MSYLIGVLRQRKSVENRVVASGHSRSIRGRGRGDAVIEGVAVAVGGLEVVVRPRVLGGESARKEDE